MFSNLSDSLKSSTDLAHLEIVSISRTYRLRFLPSDSGRSAGPQYLPWNRVSARGRYSLLFWWIEAQ